LTADPDPAAKINATKQARGKLSGPGSTTKHHRNRLPSSATVSPGPLVAMEKITVHKKHYKAVVQQNKDRAVTIEEKDGVIAEKEEDITELKETVKELKGKMKTLDIENVRLKTKCSDILKEVKELRTKKTKSSTKNEQSDDINSTIHEHIKDFVYRNTKFAQTGPELKAVTNRVWNGIKADQNLDTGEDAITFKEFNRIYGCVVQSELSLRRQYSQTRGQQAGKGMNTARSLSKYAGKFTLNQLTLCLNIVSCTQNGGKSGMICPPTKS
jgi:uncharacterized phage infection (PIP) family protein YhgE